MNYSIIYKGTKINFKVEGVGQTVVLLHGYLETKEIWGRFATKLSENYKVVAIDLQGKCPKVDGQDSAVGCTMEGMADMVNDVITHTKSEKCAVIGHSMGGYVTMAFVEKYPEKVWAFSLFHSAPFADTDEKKSNRNREIALVKQGKKDQLYPVHFPKTFANDNVKNFGNEINNAIRRASKISTENIISIIEAMRDRKDRAEILANSTIPFLYVLGMKDNFIPPQILDKIQFPVNTTQLLLHNSGHQGFIEEEQKAVKGVIDFLKNCYN